MSPKLVLRVLTCEGDGDGADFIGGSPGDVLRGLVEPEGGNERLVLFVQRRKHGNRFMPGRAVRGEAPTGTNDGGNDVEVVVIAT